MRRLLGLTSLIFVIATSAGQAASVKQFPQCSDVPVEFRIMRDFNWAERKTWLRGIKMTGMSRMHEHRTSQLRDSEVTSRYCMAEGEFSDGHRRSVYYLIEDSGGFVGLNWDVTHCVIGLDPWRVNDGNCRTLR